jgi:hypothetical protein
MSQKNQHSFDVFLQMGFESTDLLHSASPPVSGRCASGKSRFEGESAQTCPHSRLKLISLIVFDPRRSLMIFFLLCNSCVAGELAKSFPGVLTKEAKPIAHNGLSH